MFVAFSAKILLASLKQVDFVDLVVGLKTV